MDKNIAMKLEDRHSLGVISPPSAVTFVTDNGTTEVMRITKEGMWVNPSLTVDEAASAVIAALDKHIKSLVKRQPLSDCDIHLIIKKAAKNVGITRDGSTSIRIARAIEAAHGITNEP